MKNIFTFLALSLTIFCFGQFKITPENFRSIENPDKDYIVYEFPGKTKSDLFNAAKMYINSTYKGVKFDGYNEVLNEQIVLDVNYEKPDAKLLEWGGGLQVKNRIELNFKDDKMMIKPVFYKMFSSDGKKSIYLTGGSGFLGKSVFNQKGEPWLSSKLIETIERSVNTFSDKLNTSIKNTSSSSW
ncbi:hypothetical protein [Elizabethkingia anophelis]|uniref:DUF4468 domain-containing protein n=1 Tax=Elizabethkingia anophelis TaxID=1117645 RepID=A0AAU8USL7_9FLAO|nr:hypothetical protein [Elizabethkingia anophelis]AQX00417.1 hypothetical protein BBD32_02530 [Elizabethkingia anophelis]OPB66185.1 hypothetical protein BAY11_14560 [Elizabethkingia anophelis]